jgi:predicted Zn-dependent protease with MMP-like domain
MEARMRMSHGAFEKLVSGLFTRVLGSLPPDLRARAEAVTVIVADRPTRRERDITDGDDLLGLYEGVSLPDRRVGDMETVADQITIFRLPLLAMCRDADELEEEIRVTILHELGHYFGFDEDELEKRGL